MKIIFRSLLAFVALACIWWYLPWGPQIQLPKADLGIPADLREVEDYVRRKESLYAVREDNQATLLWASDSVPAKTPLSIVYLHGFGASPQEGMALVSALSGALHANAYIARLSGHGLITDDALVDLDAQEWILSAREALEIGKAIGDSVLLLSTSTGSSLHIIANYIDPSRIAAHLMFSPNIDIYDPMSKVLTRPFGLHIARLVSGGKYHCWEPPKDLDRFWYDRQRIEGLVVMRRYLDQYMKIKYFQSIHQPLFVGCYYRDTQHQDKTISVQAARRFFEQVSSLEEDKRFVEFPDAGAHVIIHPDMNPHWQAVQRAALDFVREEVVSPRIE